MSRAFPAGLTRVDPDLGTFRVAPVDPDADIDLLHGWLTHPKAAYWLMTDFSKEDIARYLRSVHDSEHENAYVGTWEGGPCFLAELYSPAHGEVAPHHDTLPGDVGMHFLVAPTDAPVRGFTLAVITTAMELAFADPATERVVVEPDTGNKAVHRLNEAVGFRIESTVYLAESRKDAYLSTCTREDFLTATRGVAR